MEFRKNSFSFRSWDRWIVSVLLACLCTEVRAELRSWTVGDQVSWESQRLRSTAISFGADNSIELLGFRSEDNIVQQMTWIEGFPVGFIEERPEAHIWDNAALKYTNIPLIDGDPVTSSEGRFKRFGVSQEGTAFFMDLGTRFPLNRIVFFPRLEGSDEEGRPFVDDFIRSYDLSLNDGLNFNEEDVPIYSLLKKVDFTRESLADTQFPLQFIRYMSLRVNSANPFELAEIQLFGSGFAPSASYVSTVIDLGERGNFSNLHWSVEQLRQEGETPIVVTESAASISTRMRTGLDDSPLVYFRIANLFTRELELVTEEEYNSLDAVYKGPIENDLSNWSEWSAPFFVSGQRINLPSPRRFFQFEVSIESDEVLDGLRLKSLTVDHSIPPLAQQVVGEISLLSDPQPFGNVPVVSAGAISTLAYDVIADVSDGDIGFDAIRIFTPSSPQFKELFIGDPPVAVVPDQVEETEGYLNLLFSSQRAKSQATGTIRVVFDARVFVQGTFFEAEVSDSQSEEQSQRIDPGDANPDVTTNNIRVLTTAESSGAIFSTFAIQPKVFSPNGDDRNDQAKVNYTIAQLVRPVAVEINIFDLAGHKVRSLFGGQADSGTYSLGWDGRDGNGALLPVGLYLVKGEVITEAGNFTRLNTVGIVY